MRAEEPNQNAIITLSSSAKFCFTATTSTNAPVSSPISQPTSSTKCTYHFTFQSTKHQQHHQPVHLSVCPNISNLINQCTSQLIHQSTKHQQHYQPMHLSVYQSVNQTSATSSTNAPVISAISQPNISNIINQRT